jgi:hypothetical protein
MIFPSSIHVSTLAFLAVSTVFISLLPINIETQPIVACLLILIRYRDILVESITGDLASRLMAVLSLTIILYACFGFYFYGVDSIMHLIKLMIPILFYLAIKGISFNISKFAIYSMVFVHLVILFLIMVGYAGALKIVFSRYAYAAGGELGSGISFLSQEPGYAGMYIFAIIVSIWCGSFLANKRALCLFFILLLILTKSVFSFIFAILAVYMIFGKRSLYVFGVSLPVLFLVLLPDDGRVMLLFNALQHIDMNNFLISIVSIEPSGTTRLLKNIPSAYYGLLSIWGYGLGSFSDEFSKIVQSIELFKHQAILSDVYYGMSAKISPDSFLSLLIFEMGWVSFLYIFAIIITLKSCRYNKEIFYVAICTAVLFSLQSQISNPILLYLLVLMSKHAQLNRMMYEKGRLYELK